MSDEGEKHVRRKRYRGSHPRLFSEKYKERHPEDYPEGVERVLARGDTPAGTHRPICVEEIMACLAPAPGEIAVDATLGYGGHAKRILKAILPDGRLYGFDRDPIELAKTAARIESEAMPAGSFVPVHANFARLPEVLEDAGLAGVDLFLADLGVSSMQIDDPERGFSFKRNGPLDMRMDPRSGMSAREYLAAVPEAALRGAIAANADLEGASAIAHAICLRRGNISTTRALAEAICSAYPGNEFKSPEMQKILRRSFQAIRIEVNTEFSSLETLLAALPSCLNPGGRAAILAFHSGEDRRIEAAFGAGFEAGYYSSISGEAIRPGQRERYDNPRSSSAKLRWALRSRESPLRP
jgi:16S rRNA (cytosine1402-N4)-methyltransferase